MLTLWAMTVTPSPADHLFGPSLNTTQASYSYSTPAATSSPTAATSTPTPYRLIPPLLDTPWTEKVGTDPWPQHPRPLLYREDWLSLNGIWTFQPADSTDEVNSPPASATLSQEVLIPSCIESGISGIMATNLTQMWFSTSFTVPSSWNPKQRVLLNFEAVDYEATVFVNGKQVSFHRGGYFRFTIDVTDQINLHGPNDLLVFAFDPTDEIPYYTPHGKQTKTPSHIFYTPCSGIWQSVWLESVPDNHITKLDITADMDGNVNVMVHNARNETVPVQVSLVAHNGAELVTHQASAHKEFSFHAPSAKLWTPGTPNLYNISVTMGYDTVRSYTGFRSISSGVVNGIQRPLLNGEFVFQFGTLDQGYWPDGIYLPPTLEAMVYDLKVLKDLGMNMVRKHIKVEPDLFYQACDQLGLLVVQDMPSMRPGEGAPSGDPAPEDQEEFGRQLELMVNQFKGYPSIVTWVIYNEGWGQLTRGDYPEFGLTDRVRRIDPTRLINSVTGWHDHGAGDFHDNHHYADPQCGTPWYSILSTPYDPQRIGFQGEFGGLGHVPAKENLWPVQRAVDAINQTYEISANLDAYNYRSHILLRLLRDQVALHACSGAVYTQTTDVEGEVNGLVTYDRRVTRVNATQWKDDIQALYDAANSRT
ncbi:glycoside hydrolase superfamily [Apodospora peruviana]|uniref:Glycoside hydrolase superfamily n=1 Tax=Apodospora peruviana TaxID=516989 RepID=A0AAE0MFM4_9PEZI|nr:glycoside hydrolase superfamily [Apodospora peruviana]